MPNIALHRPDYEWAVRFPRWFENRRSGTQLSGISSLCSRPVALKIRGLAEIRYIGVSVRSPDCGCLRF